MVIISQTPEKPLQKYKKPLMYLGVTVTIGGITVPALASVVLSRTSRPSGTYLSPQPGNMLTQAVPTPTPTVSPQEAILSAQAFLEKAITLSQKTPQTEDDKNQIVAYLNEGLHYANSAVTIAPQLPQSYLIRARVLSSSTTIRPDALQLAQQDLEVAQRLSGGQKVDLPTRVDLLEITPPEQASLDQDIIIAAPDEGNTASSSADTDSNVHKNQSVIKKGSTEVKITDPSILPDSYIYLISSDKDNHVLFVKSKSAGNAVISLDSSAKQDVHFEYWVINQ